MISLSQHASRNATLGVKHQGGGYGLRRNIVAQREEHLAVEVRGGGIRNLEGALEGFRGGLLIAQIHAHECGVALVVLCEAHQIGSLRTARRAARVPEVQHGGFTAQIFGGDGGTVEHLGLELDRFSALTGRVFAHGAVPGHVALVAALIGLLRQIVRARATARGQCQRGAHGQRRRRSASARTARTSGLSGTVSGQFHGDVT